MTKKTHSDSDKPGVERTDGQRQLDHCARGCGPNVTESKKLRNKKNTEKSQILQKQNAVSWLHKASTRPLGTPQNKKRKTNFTSLRTMSKKRKGLENLAGTTQFKRRLTKGRGESKREVSRERGGGGGKRRILSS